MKSRRRREVIEDIQYAAFWLANEVHSLPPGRAFLALLGEISDEAIDLAVRRTTAGRQITAVLTDALATKLHGDPRSEYRLEWTEEERLDSAFLVVSALHMEALRRRGVLDVRKVPPDPWAPRCGFRVSAHRGPPRPSLERMGTNESVSPESFHRILSSPRRPTGAWSAACLAAHKRPGPGPAHRCFRASRQLRTFVR
jgi:hypothetical protein